jgi:hypothetical protein
MASAICGRNFFKIPRQLTTRGAPKEGGMGVSPIRWLYEPEAPPVKETGVAIPPCRMSQTVQSILPNSF